MPQPENRLASVVLQFEEHRVLASNTVFSRVAFVLSAVGASLALTWMWWYALKNPSGVFSLWGAFTIFATISMGRLLWLQWSHGAWRQARVVIYKDRLERIAVQNIAPVVVHVSGIVAIEMDDSSRSSRAGNYERETEDTAAQLYLRLADGGPGVLLISRPWGRRTEIVRYARELEKWLGGCPVVDLAMVSRGL